MELYHSQCADIPNSKGVYRVIAPEGTDIQFLETTSNTYAPLYQKEYLTQKYERCRNQSVLYIGKANGRNGLRQRLRQYMNYGWNGAVNHQGGRAVWQIKNADRLLLEYECCDDCEVREHQLLEQFLEKNGVYPVANWRG